jgi:hypothetical protein
MSWKITRIHKHEKKTEEFEAMPSIPKFSPEELTIPAQPAEVAQPLNVTQEEVPTPETPNSQTPEPLPTRENLPVIDGQGGRRALPGTREGKFDYR